MELKSSFHLSQHIFFRTRDVALLNQTSLASASRQLQGFAKKNLLTKITRGLWANTKHPYFGPLGCVPYLLDQEQGYVSFLTALHRHGVMSQIPRTIQVATTGHSRRVTTPIGVFEFFQVAPNLFAGGIDWANAKVDYRIASPEKSLLDSLYLSTRKGRRFAALPELDMSRGVFRNKEFRRLLTQQIQMPQIREAILTRYMRIIAE